MEQTKYIGQNRGVERSWEGLRLNRQAYKGYLMTCTEGISNGQAEQGRIRGGMV